MNVSSSPKGVGEVTQDPGDVVPIAACPDQREGALRGEGAQFGAEPTRGAGLGTVPRQHRHGAGSRAVGSSLCLTDVASVGWEGWALLHGVGTKVVVRRDAGGENHPAPSLLL